MPEIIIPPDTLIFPGDSDWKMSGNPRWLTSFYELDKLFIPYRGRKHTQEDFMDTLIRGTPASGFDENMFLYDWTENEHDRFPEVTLIFMGRRDGTLPPRKSESSDSVLSATSSRGRTGTPPSAPLSVQYYGPTNVLSWITRDAKGIKGTCPDPEGDAGIITVTLGDAVFDPGSLDINIIVANFFTQSIIGTLKSTQLITTDAGGDTGYWLNVERKTKVFQPFIINVTPGFYPIPFSIGQNYQIGDVISINSGGVCTMQVTALWTNGGILGSIITGNSMSRASETPITAIGGHGSGAQFTVIQVG